jgi:hypothetical protein
MTKLKLFGAAAAILSSALVSPLMAQEVIYNPGYCAQFYPDANCQNKGWEIPTPAVISAGSSVGPIGTAMPAGRAAAMNQASGPLMSRLAW